MTTNPTNTPEAAERARFEAWAGEKGYVTTLSVHIRYRTFVSRSTEYAWIGWQARAALAAQEGGGGEHDGYKEAAIAWAVCASIHREYAKGRDPLYTTRQADYTKAHEAARTKAMRAAQEGTGNDR